MTFGVAAAYGIAICVATVTLILLPLMARSPDRAVVAERRERRSVQPDLFGRKDIR
jgi:predicted RND superfamily exporter protein